MFNYTKVSHIYLGCRVQGVWTLSCVWSEHVTVAYYDAFTEDWNIAIADEDVNTSDPTQDEEDDEFVYQNLLIDTD